MKTITKISLLVLFFTAFSCESNMQSIADQNDSVDKEELSNEIEELHKSTDSIKKEWSLSDTIITEIVFEEEILLPMDTSFNEIEFEENVIFVEEKQLDIIVNEKEIPDDQEIFSRKMIVHCPRIMTEGSEYNILACIYEDERKNHIIEEIAQNNNIQIDFVEKESKIKAILITKNYHISIIYDKSDFELLSESAIIYGQHKDQEQWYEWMVKPIKPGKDKHISISVKNIDKEGKEYKSIPSQNIIINVEVDTSGLIDNLWIFIRDNPKWTLSSIIIPIITYLFGLFMGKGRRRKSTE